jgi:NAD(P)-dependent dehydrogenase (short-subunit alcohol dehydrogenase family)
MEFKQEELFMKYAVFTGAAGGLGSSCAIAMAERDWTVFVADINEKALAEMGKNKNIIPLKVDITDEESVEQARAKVEETTDSLQAVINFAGIHAMSSLIEGDSPALVEKMLKINVMGMVRINKAFFDLVKKGKGRIVNCSSECGWMKPQPFNGPYTLTKYAVEAYNDSLRRELLCFGIPVVKIQPGSFKTNMHAAATASFDRMFENTEFYKHALTKLKPLMDFELKHANDLEHLVKAVIKAVEDDKPKHNYRVKNSRLIGTLELIPDKLVDAIYKIILS